LNPEKKELRLLGLAATPKKKTTIFTVQERLDLQDSGRTGGTGNGAEEVPLSFRPFVVRVGET